MKTYLNKFPFLAMLFSSIILTGCGENPGGAFTPDYNANHMTKIDISASPLITKGRSGIVVPKGYTQPVTAIAHYLDGTTKDLTDSVQWHTNANFCSYLPEDKVFPAFTQSGSGLRKKGIMGENVGDCSVYASFEGMDSNPMMITVTDPVLEMLVLTSNINTGNSIAKGHNAQLTVTGHYGDGTTNATLASMVTWTVPTTTSVTIDNNGVVTGVAEGDHAISATLGTVTSNNLTIPVTAKVIDALQITPAEIIVAKNFKTKLTVTATYSDKTTAELTDTAWNQTGLTGFATIANNIISANAVTSDTFKTFTASKDGITSNTAKIKITAAELVGLQISSPAMVLTSIPKGLTAQLEAIGTFSDGTKQTLTNQVNWAAAPGNTNASVDSATGILTASAVGDTTVSATYTFTPAATSTNPSPTLVTVPSDPLNVTVTNAKLTKIEVVDAATNALVTSEEVVKGSFLSKNLKALGTFTDTDEADPNARLDITNTVSWPSDIQDTALIGLVSVSLNTSNQAVIKGMTVGNTKIFAQLDGIKSAPISFLIKDKTVASIELQKINPTTGDLEAATNETLAKGLIAELRAIATYTDGSKSDITNIASWKSDTLAVATVSSDYATNGKKNGVVTVVAESGTTPITASTMVGTTTITSIPAIEITAAPKAITAIQITAADGSIGQISLAQGLSNQLKAMATYTDATPPTDIASTVTWASDNAAVEVVANTGSITAKSFGSATITASIDVAGVSTPMATFSVTVNTASVTDIKIVPFSPAQLAIGSDITLQAKDVLADGTEASVTGTVVWSVAPATSSSANATIDSTTGVLSSGSVVGDVIVTATRGTDTDTFTVSIIAAPITVTSIGINSGSTADISIATGFLNLAATEYRSDTTSANATNVDWTSSNVSKATATKTGANTGKVTLDPSAVVGDTIVIVAQQGTHIDMITLTVTP